jgi:hypothetical protein
MADLNQKLYELKHGTFASSKGAWAILSRHLQVVADNVPLSNYFVKHQSGCFDGTPLPKLAKWGCLLSALGFSPMHTIAKQI